MDFFEHQDVARRKTGRLILLFVLAIVSIVLVVYAVALLIVNGESDLGPAVFTWPRLWNPGLFAAVSVGTISIIALGSAFKVIELAGGGEKVALMLGGRLVDHGTLDLPERRLLNVVEEMAIASGTPVPPVYVMGSESSINAFAAGYAPGDAVIGVTRGCIENLTRDELQGVVAHEFSHILNGDMRLNVRLIGLLHGILLLSTVGYILMRVSGGRRRSSNRKGDAGAAIVLLGLTLLIVGYVGVFFGKLIKASVSRQREFLADASAVQFTRQPGGLAGALKKIGGLSKQSRIEDAHAAEASHMFFGDAFAGSMFNLLSTHPPLNERIRRIDPSFDGQFPVVKRPAAEPPASAPPTADLVTAELVTQGLQSAHSRDARVPFDAGDTLARVGTPQDGHLLYASVLLAGLPPGAKQMVHEPYTARAVIYALLLDADQEVRQIQERDLRQHVDEALLREFERAAGELRAASELVRLPLTEMALPSLKQLSPSQYRDFREMVERLVRADQRVALSEYVLWKFVVGQLDEHFGKPRRRTTRYHSLKPLMDEATVLLAVFARVGNASDEVGARQALAAGAARLGLARSLDWPPREACSLGALDAALTKLAQASPPIKRRLLDASAAVVAANDQTTVEEAELLRAVAELLGCPMPPHLPRLVDQQAV